MKACLALLAPGQAVLWVMEEGGPGPPDALTDRFTAMSEAVARVSGYQGRQLHRFCVRRLWD